MSPACSPVCPDIGKTILLILLSSGLCASLYHYHFVNERKTWHEAQKYCREKYTDLATVDNMDNMTQLIAAAGSGYEGKVWLGLYDKPNSWLWSLKDHDFYGLSEKDFTSWGKGQPDEVKPFGMLCVSVQQGFWYDYPCDEEINFVCYNNTNPQGLPTTATERYFFINKKRSWIRARLYCQTHHTDLASVRNETENEVIEQVIPDDQMVTIGLYRISWYMWSDNTVHLFQNWADGHPSDSTKSCAVSVISSIDLGKWMEYPCDRKFHFMCQHNQHDVRHVFNVKLTALKSTIDLNDPAVMEAILNLLEKKMKDKGFTRDFKISWIKTLSKSIFHKKEKADAVKTDL